MAAPFTPTSSSTRGHQPLTPKSLNLKHRMSSIFSTPKRMNKRSNIPPPLAINGLISPATIKRMTYIDPDANLPQLNQSVDSLSTINSGSILSRNSKHSATNQECGTCGDSIKHKFANEKIITLKCNHMCHFNCYLISMNPQNLSTNCSICNKECLAQNDEELELIFKHFIEHGIDHKNDDEKELDEDHIDTPTPIPHKKFLSYSPHTPLNQTTKLEEDILKAPRPLNSATSIDSIDSINLKLNQYSTDDLIKPNINVISEFNKYNVNPNLKSFKISNLLNIFTNEFESAQKLNNDHSAQIQRESEIKDQIHKYLTKILQNNLKDNKDLNFDELPQISLFDSFHISVDGCHWEITKSFLFNDFLIILNNSMDGIIGTVVISNHLTNLIVQDDIIFLYFNTQTLPELQIKSSNKILSSKWANHLLNLKNDDLSLIKMSTNLWDLIRFNNDIQLPEEILKFSDLSSKGLDLPFQMIKTILPKPKPRSLKLVITIPLFNLSSTLSNDEYLSELKTTVLNIIDNLRPDDNLGFVVIGRDGSYNYSIYKSAFIGMFSKNYDGLNEIINNFKVINNHKEIMNINYERLLSSCFKSCYNLFLTSSLDIKSQDGDGIKNDELRKLLFITNKSIKYNQHDSNLIKLIERYDLCINEILITENSSSMINLNNLQISNKLYFNYRQYKFENFTQFNDGLNELMKSKYHLNYLNNLTINLSINPEFQSFLSFDKFEINGDLKPINFENSKELILKINELNNDDFYKDLRFDLKLDVNEFQLFDGLSEFELIHINYSINHNSNLYGLKPHKLRLSMRNFEYSSMISNSYGDNIISNDLLMDHDQHINEDTTNQDIDQLQDPKESELMFLEIPLLPPLSSFKDSLFVKREIELMIIKELMKNDKIEELNLNQLITLIFGLTKGCSTNYLNFFKNWKYKKFQNYIDNFILKNLNKLNRNKSNLEIFNSMKIDFVNKLVQEIT
ncbi:hypothetical protein WICMUC_001998 [Wickerhamomyces mucosus]|uniref:Uncharacterized protein n=1 Tax=Wickerhamomyces mucosus TaxID=1378264 RepID=A0A9P8PQF2_9ASCO|nr:hypothetical protein WICMUC_001998 [Wickerhamomyces mucosus]